MDKFLFQQVSKIIFTWLKFISISYTNKELFNRNLIYDLKFTIIRKWKYNKINSIMIVSNNTSLFIHTI